LGVNHPDSKTLSAFIGAVLIGGANFIAVSVSNRELPPLFGAALRFGGGALLFLLIARAARVPLARGRSAARAALYGILGFGLAYACLYYALVGLAAGTAAVIVASAPLLTLLIAVLIGQERLSLRAVVAGLLAIGGVAVLSLGTIGGGLGSGYFLAAILGTAAMAASSVVAKGSAAVHPVNMNAIGMLAGTLLLAAGSLLLGETWALPRQAGTLAAFAWLVILGSVGLFQLFLYVVRRWTASATVYAVTGMPVVAILLGATLLDQPITTEVVVGGFMVLAAVYVGAIAPASARADAAPLPSTSTGKH
jgi:drug/metabolite transporter (DMT)-like permease